jgi:hypothetical protein
VEHVWEGQSFAQQMASHKTPKSHTQSYRV